MKTNGIGIKCGMLGLVITVVLIAACRDTKITPAGPLTPFEQNGLWGYRDSQNRIVIPPRYRVANEFSDCGLAAVVDAEGWVYIDTGGRAVIRPFVFDNGPDYFQEGLARFVKNGKFGFFDRTGKVVIPARYDFAYPFDRGKAKVGRGCKILSAGEHQKVEGGVWEEIDQSGNAEP